MPSHTEEELERILYPDSDGKPMADNTLQFEWIVRLQGNLDDLFRDDEKVFVVGDLLWYAVRGEPSESLAPDVMVVFGRPKGYRGSYKQWREDGIPPQVVFEVLSPSNTAEHMGRKHAFYDRHSVEEYYLYDPEGAELFGWLRRRGRLRPLANVDGWTSPRLGIRFDLSGPELVVTKPDGEPFLSFLELAEREKEERREKERARREAARERRLREKAERDAAEERRKAEEERRKAEEERRKAGARGGRRAQGGRGTAQGGQLREMLRQLGVDPDRPPSNGQKRKKE